MHIFMPIPNPPCTILNPCPPPLGRLFRLLPLKSETPNTARTPAHTQQSTEGPPPLAADHCRCRCGDVLTPSRLRGRPLPSSSRPCGRAFCSRHEDNRQGVKVFQSFISDLHCSISKGLPHAEPIPSLRIDENELVRGVLQMLQGLSSHLFYWDEDAHHYQMKDGIYASHLSQTSLSAILSQYLYSATCLKRVEYFLRRVEGSRQRVPTLKAFANSVRSWLKRLQDIASAVEVKATGSDTTITITLLELTNSLSSLCSGAEHLLQVVYGAIPSSYFESETSVPAGAMAAHILDHLFRKLYGICLVQGGEEEPYHTLLTIFTGSLLPYLEGLDSWLYDGILDDPFEEMFFYANGEIAIDQPSFWERSYLLRLGRRSMKNGVTPFHGDGESTLKVKREAGDKEPMLLPSSPKGRDQDDLEMIVCPVFLKDLARAIVSAGKSLQLVQHVQDEHVTSLKRINDCRSYERDCSYSRGSLSAVQKPKSKDGDGRSPDFEDGHSMCGYCVTESTSQNINPTRVMGVLTLSEVFLVSMAGLVGDGSHLYEYFKMSSPEIPQILTVSIDSHTVAKGANENLVIPKSCDNIWYKLLDDTVSERKQRDVTRKGCRGCIFNESDVGREEMGAVSESQSLKSQHCNRVNDLGFTLSSQIFTVNPVITVCREFLSKNMATWDELNISRNFHLPPLNDECLREAIFGKNLDITSMSADKILPRINGTDYTLGFHFDELEQVRLDDDKRILESLFPLPTILPCFEEDLPMPELLPFQKNSTLASRICNWIQNIQLRGTPCPAVIIQECITFYIKKQVDHVGKHILLKFMTDWKLMDELGVLRAVYLLGSGDLLQQFLLVIYDKLDKGEPWDDDFELNTILQESIRNSADGSLLSSPDSLVVSITKQSGSDDEANTTSNVATPRKGRSQFLGIDPLDLLKFSYKVSWPLDLIANARALTKYNQVMRFLLKVKRAKFVLDKARKWMWKGKRSTAQDYKHHLLLEQKLLHFVDAFHQYVMDRVFHSAWIELCSGMASAGSLDEVIEVHEAYLLSIQRQCFVAPDKLWALIASRIKSILGLAHDFYWIQQTLSSGGVAPAIKARCEMEVDQIEKQFDDCIAFLLRVLSFKLNVGHFPHLADLVTRINYNYYYMSSSGNLQTVPSFEAIGTKLGKTSAFQTE